WSVAWSPDGKWVAAGSELGTLELRNAPSGKKLACCVKAYESDKVRPFSEFNARYTRLNALAWSPDSKLLATAGADRSVRLWQPPELKQIGKFMFTGEVSSVAWSPDGKMLAAGGEDDCIRIWDVKTGKPVHSAQAHEGMVTGLVWSPDGKL